MARLGGEGVRLRVGGEGQSSSTSMRAVRWMSEASSSEAAAAAAAQAEAEARS